MFSIGQKDGNLKLERRLDRETRDYYKTRITASDNGVPILSSSAEVTCRS